jgi:beta-mannosidase
MYNLNESFCFREQLTKRNQGWDWGPKLLTCGPWRPITLEIYTARISDLYFATEIDESLKSAEVVAKADIEGEGSHVQFEIVFEGKSVGTETVSIEDGFATSVFRRENPELWYPAGYGKQPLYTLKASLWSDSRKINTASKRFGLRRAKVIQQKLDDTPGSTFVFKINNIPIFCGGSCWIPAESFIPRLSPEKYREWVKLAVDCNHVMLRVWGGGIWEQQTFYDACDELGVLVWQDFLFACGNYPGHKDFLHLVEGEAIANLKLLRHHPSIVMFAGNNEDYQYRESENLDYDPSNHDSESWLKTSFPARYIYEKLLVDVTQDLVPGTYYHFGSPFGGSSTRDPTVGDIHQWNVWHGTQERYQDFDRLSGRFVSEFGMEAFPSIRTIDSYLPLGSKDPDRYPQSSTVDLHNKAAGHERRLATYLTENLKFTFKPFEQYIYATQLLQAEALGTAYRLFRRQWRGPGKEYCAGALVWQLNDCWPVTSWSIVDYYLRPKLAYFAIKRELKPITIGMKQTTRTSPADQFHHRPAKVTHEIEIWASNLSLIERKGSLTVKSYDIITGKLKGMNTWPIRILPANRSTELATWATSFHNEDEHYRTVTVAYLYDAGPGQQLASSTNWPEPLKYVPFQQPKNLHFNVLNGVLLIRSEVPVKGVMLELEDDTDDVKWEDNGFDLIPHDIVAVRAHDLKESDVGRIRLRYLGSEGECGR